MLFLTLVEGTGREIELSASERKSIEAQLGTLPAKYHFTIPEKVWEPEKTPASPTGVRGRMAVFEVLEMSTAVEKIILDNPVDSRIWAASRAEGMMTMQEDAMLKAFNKQIPFSEVNMLSSLLMAGDQEAEHVPVEKEKEKAEAL